MIVYPKIANRLFVLSKRYHNSSQKIIQAAFQKYYKKNDLLPGYCTPDGTESFIKINNKVHQSNWREPKYISQKLKVSSIGIGTQGGDPNNETDLKMFEVIVQGIKSGKINTLDTDINFRYGKSQKTINAVLNYLHHQQKINRNSIFVTTKCGYIPNDIDSNLDEKAFTNILLEEKYITKEDIVNQVHCLHPNFIQFSVEKSLLSLGIETIDLLYLNNPTQSQQTVVGKLQYFNRLQKAFECLEGLRAANKIRYYGVASFISFRSPPNQQGIHVQLNQIVSLAEKVGGVNHGLRFMLVPFNLGMPEVLMKWQVSKSKAEQHIFKIAEQCKVNINFCCPLFQGRVANLPFKSQILNHMKNNAAKHLQFVRSVPKQAVLSTYFSTLNLSHLKQNLQVTEHPYLTGEEWKKVLPL